MIKVVSQSDVASKNALDIEGENIPVKYYVFVTLSTKYNEHSIHKVFDTKDEAERFLEDLNYASTENEDLSIVDDYDEYLQGPEEFKESFPYFYEQWVNSFDKEEDVRFGPDIKYEGAIPEELTMDDNYEDISNIDFQAIIEGKAALLEEWD